jgi:uncharacterized 2Fe-2S/4Fe-4S cluster protein (DUF4445 family)
VQNDQTQYRIRFEPDGVTTTSENGSNLMQVAIASGVHINASCGGTGTCGTCNVLIREGKVDSVRTSKISLSEYENGVRQSCQSRVRSDLIVEIPPESRLEKAVLARETAKNVADGGQIQVVAKEWPFEPVVSKIYLELEPPTTNDNTSDSERLIRALREQNCLGPIDLSYTLLSTLASTLRFSGWQVTATVLTVDSHSRLINLEKGDTRTRNFALAFDIGTTAVRGQLLDLGRGRVTANAIDYNNQISYGADVITRMVQCQKPGGLGQLQKAVIATINHLIQEMLKQTSTDIRDISFIMVAANTVMVHFLLELDPQYLRLSPYVPTVSQPPLVRARDLGITAAAHTHVWILPSVASYVGSDIVAGIVGTGIYQRESVTLYMDIGTNGEIVAGNREWMVASAASAGPTFEGGGIKHGMLATSGAIEEFDLDSLTLEPSITTIGNQPIKGICGSGLINMAAAMLKAGLISQNGKFNTERISNRLRPGEDGWEYVLAYGSESQTGRDIVFTEIDLDNLIRSKAAMYAGCQTLLQGIGGNFNSVDQLVIAGTFGSRLNIENAIAIGLLPDLERKRFIFVGNGSLLGARLCSFSTFLLKDAGHVADLITNIELSENADFMENYLAAMFLPHTDSRLFPSVTQGMRL